MQRTVKNHWKNWFRRHMVIFWHSHATCSEFCQVEVLPKLFGKCPLAKATAETANNTKTTLQVPSLINSGARNAKM
jgi:hypothetical protein